MNLQELKNKNQPQEEITEAREILMKLYEPTVYAIPQEQWEASITLLSAMGKSNSEIQNFMMSLPTQEFIEEILSPVIEQMGQNQRKEIADSGYKTKQAIETAQSDMTRELEQTTRTIQYEMSETFRTLQQNLKARDLSPISLKLKWAGTGAVTTILLWTLLTLFKVL